MFIPSTCHYFEIIQQSHDYTIIPSACHYFKTTQYRHDYYLAYTSYRQRMILYDIPRVSNISVLACISFSVSMAGSVFQKNMIQVIKIGKLVCSENKIFQKIYFSPRGLNGNLLDVKANFDGSDQFLPSRTTLLYSLSLYERPSFNVKHMSCFEQLIMHIVDH